MILRIKGCLLSHDPGALRSTHNTLNALGNQRNFTSLDFNYVRPCLVLLQFDFNFMTRGFLQFKSRH